MPMPRRFLPEQIAAIRAWLERQGGRVQWPGALEANDNAMPWLPSDAPPEPEMPIEEWFRTQSRPEIQASLSSQSPAWVPPNPSPGPLVEQIGDSDENYMAYPARWAGPDAQGFRGLHQATMRLNPGGVSSFGGEAERFMQDQDFARGDRMMRIRDSVSAALAGLLKPQARMLQFGGPSDYGPIPQRAMAAAEPLMQTLAGMDEMERDQAATEQTRAYTGLLQGQQGNIKSIGPKSVVFDKTPAANMTDKAREVQLKAIAQYLNDWQLSDEMRKWLEQRAMELLSASGMGAPPPIEEPPAGGAGGPKTAAEIIEKGQ